MNAQSKRLYAVLAQPKRFHPANCISLVTCAPVMLLLFSSMCSAVESDNGGAREPNDVAEASSMTQAQTIAQQPAEQMPEPQIQQPVESAPQPGAPAQPPAGQQAPAAAPQPASSAGGAQTASTLRTEVFGLATGGGAVQALEEAKARPDIFTPVDIAQLEELSIRQQVRGGRDKARAMTSPDRFDGIDAALKAADDLEARLPDTPEYQQVRYSLAGDRTVAYAGRGQMNKAVSSYESIPANQPVSVEALASAGEAYSYLNDPAKAEVAYRRAIQQETAANTDPATRGYQYGSRTRPIDLREGLFYALTDQNKFVEAGKVLDDISSTLPPPDQVRPWDLANDDYLRLNRLRAQYLIYVGQTDAGLAELKRLEEQVPFSAEVRNAEADAMLGKGRNRLAKDMYVAALNDHPDNIEALAGLGRTSLNTGDYANATQINTAFDDTFPENGSVRNFKRDYDAWRAPTVSTELAAEHGASAIADEQFSADTYIYSPPIYDYWRIFAHNFYMWALTDIGRLQRIRNGAGGDFRRGPLTVQGEVSRSTGGDGRTGGNGQVEYSFNDFFKATAGFDSDSNELPSKAYVSHIWGRTGQVAFSYTDGDRRSADIGYNIGRYSDENFHQEITAGGTQRIFTAPNQQINATLRLGTSSNTLQNTPYFSPSRDYSGEVGLMHQWAVWRSGERSLLQRFYISGGAYNQRGFGTSGFWAARLEHAWTFSHDITLTYGIGIGRHAYDGDQELSETAYALVTIPF
ncbi:Poly-beta-1,6-N-acetyl-D-glucosamine export protein [Paraburkholderia solisilvae]|uniref:Poly-beta-1,6-N-acetyl-D-glucosamine export protein n=2 Tax=Paraburkholderia solisilvae TaxID=624376 RepID=A0A6J5DDK7_9BURK|nr:Poly-beta-1,6-N-acetyl-D-glucosamine export protein [Paraburkholderia solisilvae]